MWNRRSVLKAGLAGAAAAMVRSAEASDDTLMPAHEFGIVPNLGSDQSAAFARLLEEASTRRAGIALPAGNYLVAGLSLPRHVHLSGLAGATRLIHAGDGPMLLADRADRIEFHGLVVDGNARWLGDEVRALIDIRRTPAVVIDGCRIVGSSRHALSLENAGGRIERSTLLGAADCGLYSVDANGLSIVGNEVARCGNGGILVHRWSPGPDGTIVQANRVREIAARDGGTGQFGNGINVYQAGNVLVADNEVADCAFSAIRSNGGSNVRIRSNACLRSGETAIYSEFAFETAIIAENVVDGAANGISIVNFNEGGRIAVCANNVVRNMSTSGPYPADPPGFGVGITVEADTTVTGNVVENAPRYGMHLGWGPYLRNVVASGNVVRQAGTGIAVSVVDGAGSTIITGNAISDTRDGAVVGHRWSEAVTGDLTAETHAFSHLTVAGNRAD